MKTGMAVVLALAMGWGAAGCGRSPARTVEAQADQFVARLREGQISEAYGMLAEESRRETRVEDFREGAEALGLVGNRGVAWDPPYIDDDYATIEGVVTTRDGMELRQEWVFFKKGGAWEIHIVRPAADPEAAEHSALARARQPDPADMAPMAMKVLVRLADALLGGDFAEFHRETAPILRDQTTPEVFQESFEWLASPEVGFDWAALRTGSPVFAEPPAVEEDGVLRMAGEVAVGERSLGFELQFDYVDPAWKLISINIRPPL